MSEPEELCNGDAGDVAVHIVSGLLLRGRTRLLSYMRRSPRDGAASQRGWRHARDNRHRCARRYLGWG
jgi:hypothetical protein